MKKRKELKKLFSFRIHQEIPDMFIDSSSTKHPRNARGSIIRENSILSKDNLREACVASAFRRFEAFSLFERAKIGASAKKCEKGEGFPFLVSPSPPRSFHQCCARPNFCAAQSEKCLQRAENLRKRLLRRLTCEGLGWG